VTEINSKEFIAEIKRTTISQEDVRGEEALRKKDLVNLKTWFIDKITEIEGTQACRE
jgi:hypothetical protein